MKSIHIRESSGSIVSFNEDNEVIGYEEAAILASASPFAIATMGGFPLSLVGVGQLRGQLDDILALQPTKAASRAEEFALNRDGQTEMIKRRNNKERLPLAKKYH